MSPGRIGARTMGTGTRALGAKAALSPDYRRVFGELVNAQMQARAARLG